MVLQDQSKVPGGRWPVHGWIGLALVALFWGLNWTLPGLRTHWAFFPLWLGYCLTVDAVVVWRKGNSLASRSAAAYIALFFISIPAWWLFELLNLRTQNWRYDGAEYFTDLQFSLFCSLSFSTVMPAVFGTAELASTFHWLKRMGRGPVVAPTPQAVVPLFLAGWVMLALLLLWPVYFFPFLWGSLYLILEPVNVWLKNRSLLDYTAKGDWRPVLALSVGCLICAVFWEMWNYFSYPKWEYRIPFVGFLPVFEMPLLGYLGYPVFAWELYALYHGVLAVFGQRRWCDHLQICPDEPCPRRAVAGEWGG